MTEIDIRKATADDVDQLADLAHELNLFHQDDTRPDPVLLKKHQDYYEAYVAQIAEGKLIGYVAGYSMFQFHTATPGFEIQNIAVAAAHRRAGVGRGLMETLIMDKYRKGNRKFTLGVEKGNDSALAFYKTLGFVERDFGDSWRCYLRDQNLEQFVDGVNAKR